MTHQWLAGDLAMTHKRITEDSSRITQRVLTEESPRTHWRISNDSPWTQEWPSNDSLQIQKWLTRVSVTARWSLPGEKSETNRRFRSVVCTRSRWEPKETHCKVTGNSPAMTHLRFNGDLLETQQRVTKVSMSSTFLLYWKKLYEPETWDTLNCLDTLANSYDLSYTTIFIHIQNKIQNLLVDLSFLRILPTSCVTNWPFCS